MDEQQSGVHPAAEAEAQGEGGAADAGVRGTSRREFLTGALAVTGLAWGGLLEPGTARAAAPVTTTSALLDPQRIGEITRDAANKRLRGTITIRSGQRIIPGSTRPTMMRYLEGKDAAGNVVWPPAPGGGTPPPAVPGPTLRARVGDQVELTFLNHVDVSQFGNSIDRAEQGLTEGCDVVTSATGANVYPQGAGDTDPNCFHGSSSSNLHFHGTHVSPDGLGDNVLLNLRPNPAVTEESVRNDFEMIFRNGPPKVWEDLPRTWRERQLALLAEYDTTAPWRGTRGTPGNPALPLENRLLPPSVEMIRAGLWPQYQIGAYPYCFTLTDCTPATQGEAPRYQMGQAPGTHWYHAHKHGSTAINVYNGMAGAFIIEGEYDDALHRIYPNLKQQVLLVQNFNDAPPLMRGTAGSSQNLWVNGEQNPVITMRPGEIQLWRMINASVRAVTTLMGFTPLNNTAGAAPEMRQIAQDGVQFRYENYRDQPRLTQGVTDASRANAFAAGNRVDLLVKAPSTGGTWQFSVSDTAAFNTPNTRTVLQVQVAGDAVSGMDFPTEQNYPAFPDFLADIPAREARIHRTLDFGWEPGRSTPGRDATTHHAPVFMIDGRQFEGNRYDQTMVLGDVEEWTLLNTTAQIAHPFHIHVNPFQVIEIYDPKTGTRYKPDSNFIWQDVLAIPPATFNSDGSLKEAGFARIRHRFADFTGSYVQHCHMLAHEDRGMMQLLRVVSPQMLVPHH